MVSDTSVTSSPPITTQNSWRFLDKEYRPTYKPVQGSKHSGLVTIGNNTNTVSLSPSTRKTIDNNQSP